MGLMGLGQAKVRFNVHISMDEQFKEDQPFMFNLYIVILSPSHRAQRSLVCPYFKISTMQNDLGSDLVSVRDLALSCLQIIW